jgi:acyl dehydratase
MQAGQGFSKSVILTPENISAFTQASGDSNLIHSAAKFVANTRFGKIIVSAAQTSSLLRAATADYFSKLSHMLGLEFTMYFRKPVFATETVTLEGLIVQVKLSEHLTGYLLEFRGHMKKAKG